MAPRLVRNLHRMLMHMHRRLDQSEKRHGVRNTLALSLSVLRPSHHPPPAQITPSPRRISCWLCLSIGLCLDCLNSLDSPQRIGRDGARTGTAAAIGQSWETRVTEFNLARRIGRGCASLRQHSRNWGLLSRLFRNWARPPREPTVGVIRFGEIANYPLTYRSEKSPDGRLPSQCGCRLFFGWFFWLLFFRSEK